MIVIFPYPLKCSFVLDSRIFKKKIEKEKFFKRIKIEHQKKYYLSLFEKRELHLTLKVTFFHFFFLMPPKSKVNPTQEILTFLLEKNRPYSSTNLVDEMHGEYSKTVIQKALDSLVESDLITCKLCGKSSKLYFAKQDDKQVASKEELVEMDQKNEELAKLVQA